MVSAQPNTEWIVISDTSKLSSGDIIEGPIQWMPILKHYGVVVFKEGKPYVAQQSGKRFEIISLEDALKIRPIERVLRTGVSDEQILQRAVQCSKMNYSLLFLNCEDSITMLTGHAPGIDQRRFIASILLIVILIVLFFILRKR